MKNALREPPLSFDDWCESFAVSDEEDAKAIGVAAKALLFHPVNRRVLAEIERNAVHELVNTPLDDKDRADELRMMVHGVRSFRAALQMLAEDVEFDAKLPQS